MNPHSKLTGSVLALECGSLVIHKMAPVIDEYLAYRKKQMGIMPVGDLFRHGCHAWLGNPLQSSELLAPIFKSQVLTTRLDRCARAMPTSRSSGCHACLVA